jgi:TRAP-type C4-dicarboxylate transport system substrate-binding protein
LKPAGRAVAVALLSAATPLSVAAQETTLIFATTNPPAIPVNAQFLHPWAKRINEQGAGALKIDVRDGAVFANFTNFYGRVIDDVAQISWGLQAYVAGKFPRSNVVGLAFLYDKAEHGAVAYWRLLKSGLLDAEYGDIVPLMVTVFPQGSLHLAKPLRALDNLEGRKVLSGGKLGTDLLGKMAATPISLPLSEAYEALQRGTAEGIMVTFTAVLPFKLHEVTTYHVETLLGSTPGAVFMAKKRYDALPAGARRILGANSGEAESRAFGAFWDGEEARNRAAVHGMAKHTIVAPPPEQAARWRQAAAAVAEEWVKSTPDGEKVLARFRELLAEAKAGR